jgi:hypothetical protein
MTGSNNGMVSLCEIFGSDGSEYEDGHLLGCHTLQSDRSLPVFVAFIMRAIVLMLEAEAPL